MLALGALQTTAFAQDDGNDVAAQDQGVAQIQPSDDAQDDDSDERILVTGSRLARSEFTSPQPVQIISGQVAREIGLLDVSEILSATPQVTGTQIDQTFNGFVLDNGPGSQQVNFRGLGAGRTLVLVNSKRLAPAGVGGAPTTPDISLIPRIMIDRIENLLDGASSVYGSDAVAGVSNVILRSDFDGLEFEANYAQPFESGGEQMTIAGSWGVTSDNGFIGFGAEFTRREDLSNGDREFLNCNENLEIGQSGEIRSLDISNEPGVSFSPCKFAFFNRISLQDGVFGNLYRSPDGEFTNVGIPGYIESGLNPAFNAFNPTIDPVSGVVDSDGDGLQDVDFFDPSIFYAGSPQDLRSDFLPEDERLSLYTYGEYDIDILGGTTVYFEASYNNRQTYIERDPQFVSPVVPAGNPFNPCNPFTNPDGVDCYLFFNLGPGALPPPDVAPQVRIQGVRDFQDIDISQTRVVGGFKGDLGFLDSVGPLNGWSYDIYAMHSRSSGQQLNNGILNDRLILSLETSQRLEDGSVVCGVDIDGDGLPDSGQLPTGQTLEPCVPVNLFSPEKFGPEGGVFTEEEFDYLVANRLFNTVFEQSIVSGFVSGEVFELPWNGAPVQAGLGFEYRQDDLESSPDFISEKGQEFNFFEDPGASGRRDLYEVFMETAFTPLQGLPLAEELSIEAAARWTEESTYGSAWTYSVKGLYRPTDWLLARGTFGTSFRAPNAREQFLNETSGFIGVTDPCIVPDAARIPGQNLGDPETYDPTGDSRSQDTLNLCVGQGVDPTSLGLDPFQDQTITIETTDGGSQQLQPEESESFTAGLVFEPFLALNSSGLGGSWSDDIGLQLSATYYDIEVTDSIQELSNQGIINECLSLDGGTTCGRITRDNDGLINLIDSSPVNIGRITSVGWDFNSLFEYDAIPIFGQNFDLSVDVAATLLLEQQFEQLGQIDDNAGETESPDWVGRVNVFVDWEDVRFNWFTRYIQGGEEPETAFGAGPTCTPSPTNPAAPAINEQCRDVYFTNDYWLHNTSVTYSHDTWVFNMGVRNVFNREPELVDTGGVFGVRNVPIGVGYDVLGRTAFVNVSKRF